MSTLHTSESLMSHNYNSVTNLITMMDENLPHLDLTARRSVVNCLMGYYDDSQSLRNMDTDSGSESDSEFGHDSD